LLALPFGVAIGISLGLVGAGGSLLTVPVLVFVLDQDVKDATTATLIIVGFSALAGSIAHGRRGTVRGRVALWFGAAAALGSVGGTALNRLAGGDALLLAFGVLMIVAAFALLRGSPAGLSEPPAGFSPKAVAAGLAVGVLTGFFWVGGGFVIVPVLVLILHLPIEIAIGTSLVVIAIASAAALAGHLATGSIDWPVTAAFTASAVVGTLLGSRIFGRIAPTTLNRVFAGIVAVLGIFLIARSVVAIA
jgi:uncharacterized membrane protein YfcA